MAKITRIKAKDDSLKKESADEPTITRKKVVVKDKKQAKTKRAELKKEMNKIGKSDKPKKKVFILFRPFAFFGRYLKESWHELRQVRWPNRKTTWKMVLAVLVYTALFMVIITLLDLFFSWLFNLILNK